MSNTFSSPHRHQALRIFMVVVGSVLVIASFFMMWSNFYMLTPVVLTAGAFLKFFSWFCSDERLDRLQKKEDKGHEL